MPLYVSGRLLIMGRYIPTLGESKPVIVGRYILTVVSWAVTTLGTNRISDYSKLFQMSNASETDGSVKIDVVQINIIFCRLQV